MAQIEIILPAMGEGIIEAEITRWMVPEGAVIEVDTPLVEVATDKVDSEIPSPGTGILQKILSVEGDVPKVGQVIAIISTGEEAEAVLPEIPDEEEADPGLPHEKTMDPVRTGTDPGTEATSTSNRVYEAGRLSHYAFLSPLIRKMARDHDISPTELRSVSGSGLGGRITGADLQAYLENRDTPVPDPEPRPLETQPETQQVTTPEKNTEPKKNVISREQLYGSDESTIEEMDRMRKLIADHMVYSVQTAPHVTSFVESDVSGLIGWREKVKEGFQQKYNQKLTITTLILEAVALTLKDFPRINVSLDGYRIIRKTGIHIGMATALPDGNLIVPVIRNADQLNLAGLAGRVNDLAERARSNKLLPSEIQGGTFTVTNLGNFGNIAGTPVINQPEVAILAVGAIRKKPAVVQTPQGEAFGLRHILILSMAYDHRIVDGALGGSFLKSVGNRLQDFDPERSI